jgi:hypothetical protein
MLWLNQLMTTSSLTTRITDYILKRTATTLTQLEGVVVSHGFTLNDLYIALEAVHRNKAIARTVRGGEVVYTKAVKRTPLDHHTWLRANYPPMDSTNDGSGIDIDMSWLFLRSREERDAYKAAASGRPVYTKSTWQHQKVKSN